MSTHDRFRLPGPARRVVESLVPVICPSEAVELGLIADITDHVELTLGALAPLFRTGFVAGLITYDLTSATWLPARGRTAHRLPAPLAARWFQRWLDSSNPAFHQLAFAIKQLVSLAHYEMPAVQKRMGYTPYEWIDKVKKKRLEVYTDDINKHQASLFAPDPLVKPVAKVGKKEVA